MQKNLSYQIRLSIKKVLGFDFDFFYIKFQWIVYIGFFYSAKYFCKTIRSILLLLERTYTTIRTHAGLTPTHQDPPKYIDLSKLKNENANERSKRIIVKRGEKEIFEREKKSIFECLFDPLPTQKVHFNLCGLRNALLVMLKHKVMLHIFQSTKWSHKCRNV